MTLHLFFFLNFRIIYYVDYISWLSPTTFLCDSDSILTRVGIPYQILIIPFDLNRHLMLQDPCKHFYSLKNSTAISD